MGSVLKLNLPLFLLVTVLMGCGGQRSIIDVSAGADALYDLGAEAMASGDFRSALLYFQQLEARYPFSNASRQAQLDMIYAYYRSRQPESAIDAAEEFERENPTHPRVDYCLYMKGLVLFDPAASFLERMFRVDMTERPPRDTLQAFSAFQELLRRFPQSEYAPDARERMVFLRNRLALYENHVARYYMEREAYVAAVTRTKYAIEHYPGAPSLQDSLEIMMDAYRRLGLQDLALDARRVYVASFGEFEEFPTDTSVEVQELEPPNGE